MSRVQNKRKRMMSSAEAKEEGSCMICLDTIDNADYQCTLDCTHTYHDVCIQQWLIMEKPECPICRKVNPTCQHEDYHRAEVLAPVVAKQKTIIDDLKSQIKAMEIHTVFESVRQAENVAGVSVVMRMLGTWSTTGASRAARQRR